MEVEPNEPLMLAANALQELHVGVRPLTPGGKFLYLNVVDIEFHQLVSLSLRDPFAYLFG